MRIAVTESHIAAGVAMTCQSCPIALSLHEATGTGWDVSKCSAIMHDEFRSFQLPVIARNFIEYFDAGRPVAPFSFDLPIEEPANG